MNEVGYANASNFMTLLQIAEFRGVDIFRLLVPSVELGEIVFEREN